ncbi:hypothetical protein [Oscillatoria salina]|uniref:hypothetical protein n=1 Tax=Oscillatoria salina TaxID=331517 RepID=UPI001CCDAC5C|nr:hypothetical protein [Oscillatoria salina]
MFKTRFGEPIKLNFYFQASNLPSISTVIWSEYIRYRAKLRNFDLTKIEEIIKYSGERYYDVETGRMVAVGKHDNRLVIIPYESSGDAIAPVTIHATTRRQIRFRLRNRRFIINESN